MNSSHSSSSSSLLLTLYASVLVPVYSEWISREDLWFLDTAVCSQELRNKFLDLLTFCNITELVRYSDRSFDWVIGRGLRVRKLEVIRITPVIKALITRLSSLRSSLDQLVLHLPHIQVNVLDIAVDMLDTRDASKLKLVGTAITELSNVMGDDESILFIVASCPNLKRISAYYASEPFLLPLVDACQLDEINGCHLGSLVKREKCKWTYTCNLKRTSEVNDDDETAVCLGEGKYYHMNSLWCRYIMTEKDSDLLIPLIPHLTDLTIENDFVFTMLSAAVEKCRNLRKLKLCRVGGNRLTMLLLQSHELRDLNLHCVYSIGWNADECIAVIPESCPLLEVCILKGCDVKSESAMSELFSKCRFLVDFCADCWPVDCVLPFAMNVEKLILNGSMYAYKSGRAQRSLTIPNKVSAGVLSAIFAQNPGLKSFQISEWCKVMSGVAASMEQLCPLLTRIIVDSATEVDSLISLRHLLHLSSLAIRELKGITIETFTAMLKNKSSSLLSLTLARCSISGDMLVVISRLCPALTSLNLNGNPDIKNADMMKLLSGCSKLEDLSLRGCSRITSEIVSSIKSPPMTSLDVYGTGITKSDLVVAFDGMEGFKYYL